MSVTTTTYQNFVGGEWVGAVEGGTMEVLNPATGGAIAEVPRGTQADVDRAVEAAKKALPEWLETTPGERAEADGGVGLEKVCAAVDRVDGLAAERLARVARGELAVGLTQSRGNLPRHLARQRRLHLISSLP